MTTPAFLLLEIRSAFKACARQHVTTSRAAFTSIAYRLQRQGRNSKNTPAASSTAPPPSSASHLSSRPSSDQQITTQRKNAPVSPSHVVSNSESKELIPTKKDDKNVQSGRKVEVPMRIIPKAELAQGLTISPRERLHIEHLLRQPPPRVEQKVFKERLLVYHFGYGKVNWLALWRTAAIVGLSAVTVIIAPAHYVHGSSIWLVAGIWLAGLIPFVFVNWTYRPVAAMIHLHLPQHARQSPKAALEYAKNLPRDASIDISFMRSTGLMDSVHVKLIDTVPLKSRWRPTSFQWIGDRVAKGSLFRPTPTEFYVQPETARGKAARDTIPGLWHGLYKRLIGSENEAVEKWRR